MSCSDNQSNINETFIIEPTFVGADTISACTSVFSNEFASCSGNTQLLMGTNVVTLNGSLFTNNNISATTVYAASYFSGTTNLIDIFNTNEIHITGITFSNNILTLRDNKGGAFSTLINNFSGITTTGTVNTNTLLATIVSATTYQNLPLDVFVTGGTYSNGSATFRNNTGGTFTLAGFYTGSTEVNTYLTASTFSNNYLTLTNNTGGTLTTLIDNFTGLTVNGDISGNTYYIKNDFGPGYYYLNTIGGFNIYNSSNTRLLYLNTNELAIGDGLNSASINSYDLSSNRNYSLPDKSGTFALTDDAQTITASTFSNNYLTLTNNTGGTLTTLIDNFTGLTVNGDAKADRFMIPDGIGYNYIDSQGSNFEFHKDNDDRFFIADEISIGIGNTAFSGVGNIIITQLTNHRDYYLPDKSGVFALTSDLSGFTSGYTDVFVTGGTYSNGSATFRNNTGGTFSVTGLYTGATDVFVTGGTFTNNILTLRNNTGGTFTTLINNFSGLTVNGTLSATTISATTYQNLPTDIYVNGGWFNSDNLTLTYNGGGSVVVGPFNLWSTTGNTGLSGANFIGTLDATDFVIKRNNTQHAFFGDGILYLGSNAGITPGYFTSNQPLITIGDYAGSNFTGAFGGSSGIIAIGSGACQNITGFIGDTIAIGYNAGSNNSGLIFSENIFIGSNAGNGNTADDVVAIGANAGVNNGNSSVILLGQSASATTTNQLSIGPNINNIRVAGFATGAGYVLTDILGNGELSLQPITGTSAIDVFVTGGTYSNGSATFRNNTGGTFSVSGFSTVMTDVFVTGGTYTSGTTTFVNNTGGTFSVSGFGTVSSLGVIGGTPNSSGATINGSSLILQPASASFGGVVTTSAQTFNGAKTFNDNVRILNGNSLRIDNSGNTENVSMLFSTVTYPTVFSILNFTKNGASLGGFSQDGLQMVGKQNGYHVAGFNTSIFNNTNSDANIEFLMIGNYGSAITPLSGTNTFSLISMQPLYNESGGTNTLRGIYYKPTLSSNLTGTTHIAFENVNGNVILNTLSGTTRIGTLASGLTPPTTSGLTKMVIVDANGLLSSAAIPSGGTGSDTYLTASTFNNNYLTLINNTGGTLSTLIDNFSGLTVNGSISATTYLNLPTDIMVTGGTFTNNLLSLTNNTGGTVSTTIEVFTGLTVNGMAVVTTGVTTPTILGGTGTTSSITIQAKSGTGTTGNGIIFKVGNNGATTAASVSNAGAWDFGSGSLTSTGSISGFNILASGIVRAGATNNISWNARSIMNSPSDGQITFSNSAGSSFTRLNLGLNTSSAPAIAVSGTGINIRLADDSAFTGLQSLYHRFGSGSPEGVITAPIGCLYSRTDGGAGSSLYVKESGTGNTGWVAK